MASENIPVGIFRDHLVHLMQARGVNQVELARGTGIAQPHISRYLRLGRVPSYENARKLAFFFGISVDSLLASTEREAGITPPIAAGTGADRESGGVAKSGPAKNIGISEMARARVLERLDRIAEEMAEIRRTLGEGE